jgi:hypothetical protein
MPNILPTCHTPAQRRPRRLLGQTAGYALVEYALFLMLSATIVLPGIQRVTAVLMQYYQILLVAAVGG